MRALRSLGILLLLICLLLFGLLLGVDNSSPARLAFLEWRSPELPLFLWVCLALIIGILIGAGIAMPGSVRQRIARSRAERQLDASRREARDLRQIALDD
mgnify:CR=1 FL=1